MKHTLLKSVIILFSILIVNKLNAQLVVNTGQTPTQYVQNVLVGGGVLVNNVTFVGSTSGPNWQIGEFSNGSTTNLGINNGVVISSGNVTVIPNASSQQLDNGYGTSGDVDLDALGAGTTYDAAVLEFDFQPLSNTINFKYVFASEEYNDYVNSSYNDVFGFFISGPGITGPYSNNSDNIALIPFTTNFVSINNVNNGGPTSGCASGPCTNCAYYFDNCNGTTIIYDGFTTVLTATATVQPCQWYHIKLAVSDVGDGVYDSGVFLEANSFSSDAVNLVSYYTNPILGLSAIEGCSDGLISFTLNSPATVNDTVYFTISGTATNGIDYTTIQSYVIIPAGFDSTAIIINAVMDGLTEGTETVILHVQTSSCGTQDITINITNNTPIQATVTSDQTICDGNQPVSFSVAATGGVSPIGFVWSNGLGTNSNITTSPPVGVNTYTVTATDACGATKKDSVVITVNPTPTATFTVESPICAGDSSSIEYTGVGGTTFTWNLNGATILSGTPSSGNPFTITWNTANTYAITLSVTNNEGCVSALETHYIQVLGAGTPNCCIAPTPDAGPNLQFCGLMGQFQAATPDDPSYVGTWNQLTGTGVSTYGDNHLINSTITVSLSGTYTYQWNEVNGPCDSADVVSVTFIQNPIANAGPDSSLCGLNYNMLAQPSTGTGTWTGTGIITPNAPNSAVTVVAYGSYTYAWTENNSGCVSSDTVIINFLQVPNANAGPDDSGCGFNATLSADSTYPGFWTGPPSVIYVDGDTLPTTGIIIPTYTGSSYTATFTWHAHNGSCTDNDDVNITFIRPPHAEAGNPQDVCGTLAQVFADTIGSGLTSGYWTVNPLGPQLTSIVPYGSNVDISSLGSSVFHLSVANFYFIFFAQNGQCVGSDTVKVTFYDVPVAYAGADDSICGKSYNLNVNWSIDNPVGQWSAISGPGTANFVNPTNNATSVTVTQFGVYEFVWKESNAFHTICSDRDTIVVNFKTIPMPDAGLDFGVCGKFAYICADTTVADGSWSCPTSGVAYYDAPIDSINYYDASNQYIPCTWIRYLSENDTVTMYWSEFNGVCSGYDSINVYFGTIQTALQNVDPTDTFVCGPTFYHLSAQQPAEGYGYGYWIDTVANTVFSPSPNSNQNLTATIDTGGTSYYGWHHFYWITNNGGCRDTSTVVPVLFIENPVANAGLNYWPGLFGPNNEIKTDTVCGLSWQMGAIPSVGTGTWYSGTGVHFGTIIGPPTSSIYNDSVYLSASGGYTVFGTPKYREFIWQENNNDCFDSDTIRLYFAPYPSGQFAVTIPQCRHDSSMIIATTWNLPNNVDYGITNFYWQYPNGVLDSSIANPNSSDTIFVSWATGEQHPVTLITTNQWECQSGTATHNVVEPLPFSPIYDLIEASCGLCNGEIELSTSYINPSNDTLTNYYTFNWTDSIFGNSPALIQDSLCPLTSYGIIVNGQSLSPDATPGSYCHDSIAIFMPDTGYVNAQFDTLTLEQNQAAPYNVQFINTSTGGRKYSWRIYDETGELIYTSTLEDPTYNFEDEGCYQIVLVATSKWYCKDTMIFNPLCVDAPPILEVPNSFTPNGDGQNDLFRVHSKSILEFHAVILNRWGKKLYEWNNADGYWDGKIKGSDATPGVYYYIITAKGKKETDYEFKGFFYLLREK